MTMWTLRDTCAHARMIVPPIEKTDLHALLLITPCFLFTPRSGDVRCALLASSRSRLILANVAVRVAVGSGPEGARCRTGVGLGGPMG